MISQIPIKNKITIFRNKFICPYLFAPTIPAAHIAPGTTFDKLSKV
ncbi:hypothetical protein [Aliarcobacter butzleri]|nr:hypothetical protein [Aliarcobacter butzleri]